MGRGSRRLAVEGDKASMAESFIQRVAQRLGVGKPRDDRAASRVEVTVFGKHSGWNDHIPELRAEDARLVEFKRALYDGITGNVDNGQWDKLQKGGQLQPWGHWLLMTGGGAVGGGGDAVAARAWYSRDGKGRDRYPMVAAVRCGNLPLASITRDVFATLQSLQKQCESVSSADEVGAALNATETQLRALAAASAIGAPPEIPPEAAGRDATAYLAARPELGPNHAGLLRVLYHLEREFAPAPKPPVGKAPEVRPASLRVPTCADSPARAAEVWSRFLTARLNGPAAPPQLLVVVPDHARWVDAIVGPPGVSQLFHLRAPLEAFPFTSEIPYTLDPEFVARVERSIETPSAPTSADA